MPDVPTLPVYPKPAERQPVTIPAGIPNMPHPKQAAPLQKMISKMFKGPHTQKRSVVGKKSGHGRKKNQVAFY
jgi:hypothetical protein